MMHCREVGSGRNCIKNNTQHRRLQKEETMTPRMNIVRRSWPLRKNLTGNEINRKRSIKVFATTTLLFLIGAKILRKDDLSVFPETESPIVETESPIVDQCDVACCRQRSLLSSRPPLDSSARPMFHNLHDGELPGYTGWARPEYTLVSLFQVVEEGANDQPHVGEDWTIRIKCTSKQCATSPTNRGALFYARVYGPAVIPGRVATPQDTDDDTYEVTFHFFDEGTYFVELVLTFSESHPFEDYPLYKPGQNEPNYEGYMVEGFPRHVTVGPSNYSVSNITTTNLGEEQRQDSFLLPWCSPEQLELRDSLDEVLSFARWKVYDKNSQLYHTPKMQYPRDVSFIGYQVR